MVQKNYMKITKKKIAGSVSGLIVMCGIGLVAFDLQKKSSGGKAPYRDAQVIISGETITLDVVQKPVERALGLGGRTDLCAQCGMWFVFDNATEHPFWMKDMQFDIDIIWIHDGHVVYMEKNVSHNTPEKTYIPALPASHVLELPAGSVERLGITTGTVIDPQIY